MSSNFSAAGVDRSRRNQHGYGVNPPGGVAIPLPVRDTARSVATVGSRIPQQALPPHATPYPSVYPALTSHVARAPTHQIAGSDARRRDSSPPIAYGVPAFPSSAPTHQIAGSDAHRRESPPPIAYAVPASPYRAPASSAPFYSPPPPQSSRIYSGEPTTVFVSASAPAPTPVFVSASAPAPERRRVIHNWSMIRIRDNIRNPFALVALITGIALISIGLAVEALLLITVGVGLVAFFAVRAICCCNCPI